MIRNTHQRSPLTPTWSHVHLRLDAAAGRQGWAGGGGGGQGEEWVGAGVKGGDANAVMAKLNQDSAVPIFSILFQSTPVTNPSSRRLRTQQTETFVDNWCHPGGEHARAWS